MTAITDNNDAEKRIFQLMRICQMSHIKLLCVKNRKLKKKQRLYFDDTTTIHVVRTTPILQAQMEACKNHPQNTTKLLPKYCCCENRSSSIAKNVS
jgi:hypothetical protein